MGSLFASLVTGMTVKLAVGIVISLVAGVVAGPVVSPVVGLVVGVVITMTVGIKVPRKNLMSLSREECSIQINPTLNPFDLANHFYMGHNILIYESYMVILDG